MPTLFIYLRNVFRSNQEADTSELQYNNSGISSFEGFYAIPSNSMR